MQVEPAGVEGVFTEAGGPAQVVLPRGGVDDLQARVARCPVDAEVGGLPGLPGLSVADPCKGPEESGDGEEEEKEEEEEEKS